MRPSALISTSSLNTGRQITLCLIVKAQQKRAREEPGEIMAVIKWALLLSEASWEAPLSFQSSLCVCVCVPPLPELTPLSSLTCSLTTVALLLSRTGTVLLLMQNISFMLFRFTSLSVLITNKEKLNLFQHDCNHYRHGENLHCGSLTSQAMVV